MDISSADSIENKFKTTVLQGLKNSLKESFKNIISNFFIKLKDFERWFGKKIDKFFNPISEIVEPKKNILRVYQRSSERENKSTHRTMGTSEASDSQPNNTRCWLCSQNHRISECVQLIALSFEISERKHVMY